MKRIISFSALFAMALGVLAFQCSSTEMTSAKLYLQQKNLPKAKEALIKEVTKNPKSDEGFYFLGYVEGELGNVNEMLKNFESASAISNKFDAKMKESRLYHWSKSFNAGVSYFNQAGRAATEDSAKLFMDRAINSFNDAIACEPDSSVSYKNLVFAYLNSGDVDAAVAPLMKLKEIDNSPDVYVRLGEINFNKGIESSNLFKENGNAQDSIDAENHFNDVISILEEGRKVYPSDSDILLLLSNAYIKANKIEVAREAFKAGVEQEPENKFYRYNYAVLLLGANEFEEAATQFQAAIEIDSEYENAIYNLAVTYVKWGTQINDENIKQDIEDDSYKSKYEAARPYLERYLELEPEESSVWELLGKVYANLGLKEESMNAFNKADQYR